MASLKSIFFHGRKLLLNNMDVNILSYMKHIPDMSAPDGPQVGPMNLAIRDYIMLAAPKIAFIVV